MADIAHKMNCCSIRIDHFVDGMVFIKLFETGVFFIPFDILLSNDISLKYCFQQGAEKR